LLARVFLGVVIEASVERQPLESAMVRHGCLVPYALLE
jgi:hypothetical protein